jgi:hypothetical protein
MFQTPTPKCPGLWAGGSVPPPGLCHPSACSPSASDTFPYLRSPGWACSACLIPALAAAEKPGREVQLLTLPASALWRRESGCSQRVHVHSICMCLYTPLPRECPHAQKRRHRAFTQPHTQTPKKPGVQNSLTFTCLPPLQGLGGGIRKSYLTTFGTHLTDLCP